MNATKVKVYKQVLKDICNKYDEAEDFISQRIEELYSDEKLFLEKTVYLVFSIFVYCYFFQH